MIDQILAILKLIKDEEYNQPLEMYNGSSVGKHFRHIFDFFNCILAQTQSELDYCLRPRDSQIEVNREYAQNAFKNLSVALLNLNEERDLVVHADFELEEGVRPTVRSTVGRELMYAYDHAVHHLAIVKIGLKSINPSINISSDLGVAASTLRHQHAHLHA